MTNAIEKNKEGKKDGGVMRGGSCYFIVVKESIFDKVILEYKTVGSESKLHGSLVCSRNNLDWSKGGKGESGKT